jgi:hypothetical protein
MVAQVEHTRAWVDDVVRSGLWTVEEVRRQVAEALADDHPELPADTPELWIAEATDRWRAAAMTWSGPTDHDRLVEAFAGIERLGVVVLQGCADHWAARDALRADPGLRGAVWFTPPDVWHAIDEGMLEVNLWHADTANAAPGDALLDEVIDAFAEAGLTAHFDEGRIEVAAYWRRRPL